MVVEGSYEQPSSNLLENETPLGEEDATRKLRTATTQESFPEHLDSRPLPEHLDASEDLEPIEPNSSDNDNESIPEQPTTIATEWINEGSQTQRDEPPTRSSVLTSRSRLFEETIRHKADRKLAWIDLVILLKPRELFARTSLDQMLFERSRVIEFLVHLKVRK